MYEVNVNNFKATKRGILSVLSSIFDPLGWVTPIILWAKKIMQTIWTSGIGWDSPLTDSINKDWNAFITELPQIQDLRIPGTVCHQLP